MAHRIDPRAPFASTLAMYTNILIPTDGSELAGKAIQYGIALAKRMAPIPLYVLPLQLSARDCLNVRELAIDQESAIGAMGVIGLQV